ncbi:MAG: DUF2357 domain-containing protein, partial [Verrucomicrobia bacterium]|nr:DUF2357 domain-containing protein [Verrucomicrobiota bacterium]
MASRGHTISALQLTKFYAAIRAKPFVILAGNSGTGKSRLVRLFAEACGATAANGGFHLVAVRPDWSDGGELLGYLDLQNNFRPGQLLEPLLRAHAQPQQPVFVCLDEMNLARVEHYFSDFLSKIESRRRAADGSVVSDAVISARDLELLSPASIPESLRATLAHLKSAQQGVCLPPNLIVVGTVNMDETTHAFSRKVLDRANTLEIDAGRLGADLPLSAAVAPPTPSPGAVDLTAPFLTAQDMVQDPKHAEALAHVAGLLDSLNDILSEAHLQVAYRTRDEAAAFFIHATAVGLSSDEADHAIVMQKILPRVQGSSPRLARILRELLGRFQPGGSIDSNSEKLNEELLALRKDTSRSPLVRKIASMWLVYQEEGFTSFWVARVVPANVSSSVVLELGSEVSATLNVGAIKLAAGGRVAVPPLLFEQTRYEVEVVQPDTPDTAPASLLVAGKDVLRGRQRRGHAMTTINFESEIGFTRWELRQSGRLIAALRLEVFPSKLDYQSDYFALRASLESEVRMLAGALSGRTWQPRGRKRTTQQPTDLEWLVQLRGIFDEWVQAIECIDRHPRRRLVRETQLRPIAQVRRADQTALAHLRKHPNQLSRAPRGPIRIGTERWTTARLPDSRRSLDLDTPENLFVAHGFQRVSSKIRGILARLDPEKSGAKAWCDFLEAASTKLRRLEARTFLSEVDVPQHAPSITLAMHLSPGYREFLRTWNLLQAGLTLDGDALAMSEKNVATLYELWCFVALGNLLRTELGATPKRPDWLVVDHRGVALGLRKGRASELVIDTLRHGRIRVTYNRSDETPTGDCRPDNTLEVEQSGPAQRSFRYVFDAKYRLSDDADYVKANWAPGVPTDVVTRMHAYRDQIVTTVLKDAAPDPSAIVWDIGQRRYVQRTVGAFALFPYAGADAEKNRFFKSIASVGVGALPFLPSRRGEVEALIRQIVANSAETVEDLAVELSGTEEVARIVKSHEYGLLGIVKSRTQLEWALREKIYHMPYRAKQLRLRADFVVLIISAAQSKEHHGAIYHAKVRSVNFGARGSISPIP